MSGNADKQVPPKGWWKKRGLTARKFFDELERLRNTTWNKDDVEFTYNVYDNKQHIGEAARIERPFDPTRGLGIFRIGFFRKCGGLPSYTIIPYRWRMKRK